MELLQISVTVYFSLGVSSKERLKVLYLLEKKKRKKRLLYFNFRPVVLDLIRGRRFFERGAY